MIIKHLHKILILLTTFFLFTKVQGQDSMKSSVASPLQIIVPAETDWNVLQEGKEINFHLQTKGGKSDSVTYSISSGQVKEMNFDSAGHFVWTPSFDIADRINTSKSFPIVFEAQTSSGESASREVVLKVMHVNRPPQIDELQPFYVQYKTQNVYKIDMGAIRDPDGDPFVFVPILEEMPEAMKMTAAGEITWEPSFAQFSMLKKGPKYMEFYVEDQPSKERTKGRLKLDITQMDLAPDFTIIPQNSVIYSAENNRINLRFTLSDPNGEDDIVTFNFISENKKVPSEALVKNTATSYEFIWEPGYNFVKDPFDTLAFNITFYVLDKAQNKKERTVHFVIKNTVDESVRDNYVYNLYRGALVNAWGLLEQMTEKEGELKKAYSKAKKGKRSRSLLNASLGATTGLAPVVATDQNVRGYITTIGGTTVATVGTLEATEVIGKSVNGLLDRFNYVMQKKNELQNKGDVFAREYSQKSARRQPDFIRKLDEFKSLMNLSGLVALELDANWENKKEATDTAIKKAFKDFIPLTKDDN
ncbi:hypothetical protein [Dyadobacter sediminis]|uniref:Cadherin domain-containing protein n=1 Tax=Dyadobacter sediminis TaxID=1493691 RepID=A0A5R9K8S2_9BACT|nr:hypothetical protein [Dyadobacter sediminis]TLU90472.1 hypothetical protein FEM55_18080 [Dyadobacter sediminis]GGC08024.1 hypothetical protein GCM10011325_38680 [Dyadobacter sediminis]